jgi:hypothetical protein
MGATVEMTEQRALELLNRHRPEGCHEITIRTRIHRGQSGATVWEVDMRSSAAVHSGFAIAKFDNYERLTREDERTRAAKRSKPLNACSPEVLHRSPPIEEKVGNQTYTIGFLLTTYARHGDAFHIDTLQTHLERHKHEHRGRILDQITALIRPFFVDWYDDTLSRGARQNLPILDTFAQLLNLNAEPGENRVAHLRARMGDFFGIAPTAQRLIMDDPSGKGDPLNLPNPAYTLTTPDVWKQPRLLVARTPMHGDLHTGNIICQVKRSHERPDTATPWLIDFAEYRVEGVPFYDLAQLEFDLLRCYLPAHTADDWREWFALLRFINGTDLRPVGDAPGQLAPHAWKLIQPIRVFVQEQLEVARKKAPGVELELERLWHLVRAAVGMRQAQREREPHGWRSAGLLYAALAIRQLQPRLSDVNARAMLGWHDDYGLSAAPPDSLKAAPKPAPRVVTQAARLHTPHRYTPKTEFVGRAAELATLDAWARSGKPIMQVVAIGGQGKSALTWTWFNKHAQTTIPDFAGGLWWSFYESDYTLPRFVATALHLLGGYSREALDKLNREAREEALFELCRERACLFVFDGLERILNAYRTLRPGTQTDEETDLKVDEGQAGMADHPRACANPLDGEFLRRLLEAGKARLLISTRLPLRDLENITGARLTGVEALELGGLGDDDVIALMRANGVTGNRWTLIDFARGFRGHGLLLGLVAKRVRLYNPKRGDFDAWYEAEGRTLDIATLDLVQKRNDILRASFDALSPDARALIRRLAVFNFPFDFDAAMAIQPFSDRYYHEPNVPPPMSEIEYREKQAAAQQAWRDWLRAPYGSPEVAEAAARRDALRAEIAPYEAWEQAQAQRVADARRRARQAAEPEVNAALYELEDCGLIAYDYSARTWDMHPVVRGYAYNELNADANAGEAFEGKRNYFEGRETRPREAVTSIDDLRREIEIYDALIGANAFDRASDFYRDNLQDVLYFRLNAYHDMIRLLTPLFADGLEQPPQLASRDAQKACITDLANAYQYIDPDKEKPLRALNIRLNLEDKAVRGLLVEMRNFSISLDDRAQRGAALRALRLALRRAEAGGDEHQIARSRQVLFGMLVSAGQWMEAEMVYAATDAADFRAGERERWEAELRAGYAEMLIARSEADPQAIMVALAEAERLARRANDALSLRHVEYLRGEAALRRGDGEAAQRHFERYLEMQQKVRLSVGGARGGLALALLMQGKHEAARAQLEAGTDSLSAAEVWLALNEPERAKAAALKAYKELWGDGVPHYDLSRARAVLEALGEPIPDLPPFDEATCEKLPYDDEIIAFIEEQEAKKKRK